MTAHQFATTILRAYDIRGIYQETLTEADAHAIGIAFIACLRNRGHGVTVAVITRFGRSAYRRVGDSWRQGLGYWLRVDANAVFCGCNIKM